MRAQAFALGAVLAAVRWAGAADEHRELCPGVVFRGGGIDMLDLSDAERRLVCGDSESEGWRTIPRHQARYFLTSFLQQRGYHTPRFEDRDEDLVVSVGPPTRIRTLSATGLPPSIRLGKKRGIRGEPMAPRKLDELKSWIVSGLQNAGYGCPEVRVTADPASGNVHADVDAGPIHAVVEIASSPLRAIDPGVFQRYYAFEGGKPLNLRLLNLTAARIVAEDLFLSAYYDLSCSSRALTITQRVVSAPPRLITVGAGFDSEGYARGRVRWKNSRIGYRASAFEASLFGSLREQRGETFFRWYPRPSSRFHLMPRAEGRREDEELFEAVTAAADVGAGRTWDNQSFHLAGAVAPGVEYVRTYRGVGPPDSAYALVTSRLAAVSHGFEYFLRDPREGWVAELEAVSRQRGVYSDLTGHRLRLSGQHLWNLAGFDPPYAVVGWRGAFGTTWVDRRREIAELPPTLKFFLGGDADLRGFDRKGLPDDGSGFLTMFYSGVEIRTGDLLPYKLQPLAFIDAAIAGSEPHAFDEDVYWSPGLGLRWGSPVGAFRFTAARGLAWNRDDDRPDTQPRWQLFFSFGREF